MPHHSSILWVLALFSFLQATPILVRAWDLTSDALQAAALPTGTMLVVPPAQADLDLDGRLEKLSLMDGRLTILRDGIIAWESLSHWEVAQAEFTDLNHDGRPEASLLVWRPYQPWPVDMFLPYGGRIADFHDEQGNSCQIILIGWINGKLDELWAGSALADPVTSFAVSDLNGDSLQELITLEGRYAGSRSSPARALKVWEWNGFGFTIVSSVEGSFSALAIVQEGNGRILILTP
jgi:hypothetical protein